MFVIVNPIVPLVLELPTCVINHEEMGSGDKGLLKVVIDDINNLVCLNQTVGLWVGFIEDFRSRPAPLSFKAV